MSKPLIGFILATYQNPPQTLHLCRRLSEMFGDPPIAIHHDFSQTALDRSLFPPNVRFVENWIRTGWGSMSVVDAHLLALDLLYRTADPEWFINLSSADYPIQTAERIVADLRASDDIDLFLDSRRIDDLGQRYINEGLGELAFQHPRYAQGAFNRYVALPLITPRMARRLKQPIESWVVRPQWLIRRLTPFDGSLVCYGGDFWLTGRRRIAHFFLDRTPLWQRLYRHFRSRSTPEEAFFHTLLGNSSGFRIAPYNLRYTDWRGCYAHPRILGRSDLPRLLDSKDHFARKFAFEPALLADLDAAVAAKPRGAAGPDHANAGPDRANAGTRSHQFLA